VPRNEGHEPPVERVDIVYRGGAIERNIVALQRRWTLNDPAYPPNYDFDIARWQPTGRGKA
jgi:hypothetical protein